jgi:hypothetical protein
MDSASVLDPGKNKFIMLVKEQTLVTRARVLKRLEFLIAPA